MKLGLVPRLSEQFTANDLLDAVDRYRPLVYRRLGPPSEEAGHLRFLWTPSIALLPTLTLELVPADELCSIYVEGLSQVEETAAALASAIPCFRVDDLLSAATSGETAPFVSWGRVVSAAVGRALPEVTLALCDALRSPDPETRAAVASHAAFNAGFRVAVEFAIADEPDEAVRRAMRFGLWCADAQ